MTIVLTGAAGFIGSHVATALLAEGETVVGIDDLNPYYPVALKRARLAPLLDHPGFRFHAVDIAERAAVTAVFEGCGPITGVVHLAAQAGVRHSLIDPYAYVRSNLMGQVVMFEAALRHAPAAPFVYASSSSVYGANERAPFAETDRVDHPVSLYGATKRADELIAQTYAHTRGIASTGLRFFTVYGPWGRPDMAYWLFTQAILDGRPIQVFNEGRMRRDFTYIDDIVGGVVAALRRPAAPGTHTVYNLGNSRPEALMDFIAALETAIGRKAEIAFAPMQPGDVVATYADITASRRDLGFEPKTTIDQGLPRFVDWFRRYHGLAG